MKERVGQGLFVHWTLCIGSGKIPKAYRGAYEGKVGMATIALEAAVDCRLLVLAFIVWNSQGKQ